MSPCSPHPPSPFSCYNLAPRSHRAAATPDTARSSSPPLDAFAGEFTDPAEPDTPLSFYVQDGKLYIESDRRVPTELTLISPLVFAVNGDHFDLRFTLDAAGRPVSVVWTDEPNVHYHRTGAARPSPLPRLPAH